MLTVGLYYDVVKGKESDFEKYFDVVVGEIKKFDGFVSALLYHRADKPNSYLIYSEWKDRESFETFIKSREFGGAKSGGSHMLEGRPHHKIYNV
jgi:heme-degrading monooxygenase HmoA